MLIIILGTRNRTSLTIKLPLFHKKSFITNKTKFYTKSENIFYTDCLIKNKSKNDQTLSPAVRKIVTENKIDIETIKGS